MTPDVIPNSNNLFLIHPPGTGGNHLANILSLCNGFAHRRQTPNYENELYSFYKYNQDNTNPYAAFHFCTFENLNPKLILQYKHTLSTNLINIFCAHPYEYFHENNLSKVLGGIDNRCYILCSFPKEGSIAYKRMIEGPWWDQNSPNKNKEEYNLDFFCQKNNISPDYILELDTDLIVSENGFDYLRSSLHPHINIDESRRILHEVWYGSLSRYYNNG